MDIQELKAEKKKVESEIKDLLWSFHEKYKDVVNIQEVNINLGETVSWGGARTLVACEVSIKVEM